MILGVNTLLLDLPGSIRAYTVTNTDLSYTIVINARLNRERQIEAYRHELKHIENGDYDRKCSADIIECFAHK